MPQFFKKDLLTKPTPDLIEAPEYLEAPHSQNSKNDQDPLQTLIEWQALSRPFRRKDRSYYTSVAVLIILLSPVAFFFGGGLLFMALLALGFAVFVFNLVSPDEVHYKLTNQGVTVEDHFYHWQTLDSFWLSNKDGYRLLNILTLRRFPACLMLIIPKDKEEEIKRAVAKHLPFHEIVPKTTIEKWAEGLQKHFPLEVTHKS